MSSRHARHESEVEICPRSSGAIALRSATVTRRLHSNAASGSAQAGEIFGSTGLDQGASAAAFAAAMAAMLCYGDRTATERINNAMTASLLALFLAIVAVGVSHGSAARLSALSDWGAIAPAVPVMFLALVCTPPFSSPSSLPIPLTRRLPYHIEACSGKHGVAPAVPRYVASTGVAGEGSPPPLASCSRCRQPQHSWHHMWSLPVALRRHEP